MLSRPRLPDPEERPLLSVEEAAAILGLGRQSAYEACRQGQIPNIRLGRRVLVVTAQLRALVGMNDCGESEPVDGNGGGEQADAVASA